MKKIMLWRDDMFWFNIKVKEILGSSLMAYLYKIFVNSFWFQLSYFLLLSLLGFLILKGSVSNDIDVFFMSVSSVTVSSMSTVEMEVFSNTQLIIITVLMFLGGEVFTSLLVLQFPKLKFHNQEDDLNEMGIEESSLVGEHFKYNSIRYLSYVVSGYLVSILLAGLIAVELYLQFFPSASDVLEKKGLKRFTFSVFTVVSTFTNCGFIPTNENMVVFKNNSGLLLILIPLALLGNTLYPSCLRFVLWMLRKITGKEEFQHLLKNTREIGYPHLLPPQHSLLLLFTVFGFIWCQLVLFCAMEWSSGALDGMTSYQKIIGVMFQTVNSRHTGESIVDLSIISPAVLVVFVVMMYLPPYTSFLPNKDNRQRTLSHGNNRNLMEDLLLSPLSYLTIFLVIICITEGNLMENDPLNFSLFNIIIEVISTYGNVGFTTGYSCKRQINPDDHCKDKMYGLSGRMSSKGKLIMILVMFYGRLKKLSIGKGGAWKLM